MDELWFEEIVNGEPTKAELWQISYIDSLLPYTALPIEEQSNIYHSLPEMTEIEAEEIIDLINQNKIEIDPREQYKKMHRAGVFTG